MSNYPELKRKIIFQLSIILNISGEYSFKMREKWDGVLIILRIWGQIFPK